MEAVEMVGYLGLFLGELVSGNPGIPCHSGH